MSEDTLDELFLFRQDELRTFLEGHLVKGTYTMAELVAAGTVTTLAGTDVNVTSAGAMGRFDDRVDERLRRLPGQQRPDPHHRRRARRTARTGTRERARARLICLPHKASLRPPRCCRDYSPTMR